MASLAELQAQREALLKVLGGGIQRTVYDGSEITYSDPDKVRGALAEIERRIRAMSGGPLREVRINSSKGV